MSFALVLASASPRRKQLLEQAGLVFTVRPAGIDETVADGEDAVATTTRLAIAKTLMVAGGAAGDELVLGADTTVVVGDRMLGKPAGAVQAKETLMMLSGRSHSVLTAWAVSVPSARAHNGRSICSGITRSTVRMREFSQAEAARYVDEGEALDKAGAYAVQGAGRRLVAAVYGSYDNVMGLPVDQVSRALAAAGG